MKRFFIFLIFLFPFLLLSFCGKKGPIYPPLIRIPQKIEGLEAIQRGGKIILEWENPSAYVDGRPLSAMTEVKIWLVKDMSESRGKKISGKGKKKPLLPPKEFMNRAELLASITNEEFSEYQIGNQTQSLRLRYSYTLRDEDYAFKNLIFGIRIKDRKKKKSDLSNLVGVRPQYLPLPPQGLHAEVMEDRIILKWSPPLKNMDQSLPPKVKGYNIYRAEEESLYRALNSKIIEAKEENISLSSLQWTLVFPPPLGQGVRFFLKEVEDLGSWGRLPLPYLFHKTMMVAFLVSYWPLFHLSDLNVISGGLSSFPLDSLLSFSRLVEGKYKDKNFQFGKIYRYFVRASATASPPFLESEDSEVVEVLNKDIFPPDPPSGLVSVKAGNFISLSWNANQEKDLAGYRVWRREEEQEKYRLLTPELVRGNSYNDTAVTKNNRYHYAITALDESGNESLKSKIASEIIKEGYP